MLVRHAKTITSKQQEIVLSYLSSTRNPVRNRVMAMLSFYGGLRAVEMKRLTWGSILTSEGTVGDSIEIYNTTAKGSSGGRSVPIHPELKKELELLLVERRESISTASSVIYSIRNPEKGMSGNSIVVFFKRLFDDLGINASSHSGRRTFAGKLSKKVDAFTLKELMGHSSIQTTMLYVDVNQEEKNKAVCSL
jgi:integrase/recombinase XerD